MRGALVWLVLLVSCSQGAIVDERRTSEDAPGYGRTDEGWELVDVSAGAEVLGTGWKLEVTTSKGIEWIMQRVGPFKLGPTYTSVTMDSVYPHVGSVWTGVYDWNKQSWWFMDVSSVDPAFGDYRARVQIPKSVQPVSNDGYIYVIGLAYDEGSSAVISTILKTEWQFWVGFLQAPQLMSITGHDNFRQLIYNSGPDCPSPLQGEHIEVWVCLGAVWDQGQAFRLTGDLVEAPNTEYQINFNFDSNEGAESETYAVCIFKDGPLPTIPASPFSNPITFFP